jgi:uncharacterized protein involved in exopolysaccharide biosynthesis
MVRNGDFTLADVKRVVGRFWWIPPLTTLFLGTVGVVASLVLPKKFTSSTLVLVEQPTVPTDYVKPVVSDDLNRRVESMKQQVLSRSSLQPIIEKFNLYPSQRQNAHMEDLVDQLRKSVEVDLMEPMAGAVNKQPAGFHVSVTFDNPQLAQQICTDITSMFMQQNGKRREQQATDTTHFLSQQLEEAKAKIDEQDAKLAQFKRQYLGSLPEESQTNLNILTGYSTQLEAATQALNRAQQDKSFAESILSQQLSAWQATQAGQNPETLDQQLEALQAQLVALQSKYTGDHPDVIKAKNDIAVLKQKIAENERKNAAIPEKTTVPKGEPTQINSISHGCAPARTGRAPASGAEACWQTEAVRQAWARRPEHLRRFRGNPLNGEWACCHL